MRLFSALIGLVFVTSVAFAQDEAPASTLPNVQVKTLEGAVVETGTLGSSDKPLLLSFWATWCKPCLTELQTYHELFDDWMEEMDFDIVAVSIDDSRNARKVPAFAKGRNWEFTILLDENQDFKRAMNVNNVPHTFIVQNGRVVWSHAAFAPGDEEDIEDELRKLMADKEEE